VAVATIIALSLAAAQIERWVETGRDGDQVAAIDLASVEGTGRLRTAWTRADYPESRDGDVVTDLYRNEYDCEARTFTLIAYRRLDAAGRETDGATIPVEERRTDEIVPDTVGADEIALICGDAPDAAPPVIA